MEDMLEKEYIGKNSDKIIGEKYNWVAAILGQAFGPVWFFYRKSYLLGFAFILISLVIGIIAVAIKIEEASYVMFVIYLFSANKLYLWDVRRKINKICKRSYLSEEELIEKVRKKGGTSIAAAIIYSIILTIYTVLYIALIIFAVYYTVMGYDNNMI